MHVGRQRGVVGRLHGILRLYTSGRFTFSMISKRSNKLFSHVLPIDDDMVESDFRVFASPNVFIEEN